jgi:YggT family protein
MFIFGNFIAGLARVLDLALSIYFYIILARAVLSWVNPDPHNPIVRFLYRTTEPVLYWVRRRIPTSFGGIDFAPLVVILAIYFLRAFVVSSLWDAAQRMH